MTNPSTPLDELLDGSSPPVHCEALGVRSELAALVDAHAEQQRTAGSRRRRGLVVAGGATALVLAGGVTGAAAAPLLAPLLGIITIGSNTAAVTIPADVIPGQRSCALAFQPLPLNDAGEAGVDEAARILAAIDPATLDLTPYLRFPDEGVVESEGTSIAISVPDREDDDWVGEIDVDVDAEESSDEGKSDPLSPAQKRDRAINTWAIQEAVTVRYLLQLQEAGISGLGYAISTNCGASR